MELHQRRQDFLARVFSYIDGNERRVFEDILDDLIAWSESRDSLLRYRTSPYEQDVVSFERVSDGLVFWSAYPKLKEGAKFEVLPGAADQLPQIIREKAKSLLDSLVLRPDPDAKTLRVSFRALKGPGREKVKLLLDDLLAHR